MGSLAKVSFGILEGRYSLLNLFASWKTCGSSTQTQDCKVILFARICVEVDLNNLLPNSMDIFMGSSSWIQQMDYETIPFRWRIFNEYGHLHRRCPRNKSPPLASPRAPRVGKGKDPLSNGLVDSDGFTQVKSHNKCKGKKRSWMDRETDGTFNRFDALGDLFQEEGTLAKISSRDTS
jgi:hypothetical protein